MLSYWEFRAKPRRCRCSTRIWRHP